MRLVQWRCVFFLLLPSRLQLEKLLRSDVLPRFHQSRLSPRRRPSLRSSKVRDPAFATQNSPSVPPPAGRVKLTTPGLPVFPCSSRPRHARQGRRRDARRSGHSQEVPRCRPMMRDGRWFISREGQTWCIREKRKKIEREREEREKRNPEERGRKHKTDRC